MKDIIQGIAYWSISLDVECPKCQENFNVLDLPDYHEYISHTKPCDSDNEIDIYCPVCEWEFTAKTAY